MSYPPPGPPGPYGPPQWHQPPPQPDEGKKFFNMAGGFLGLSGGLLFLVIALVIIFCFIGPVVLCFIGAIAGAGDPSPSPS